VTSTSDHCPRATLVDVSADDDGPVFHVTDPADQELVTLRRYITVGVDT
jgi:hypothetical protein